MAKRGMTALVLIILFAMMISGCGGGKKAEDEPTTTFIPTGTQGIELRFVPDQPPAKLFTGQPFTVLAEVRNRGTYDIQNVDIFISGFDPQLIQVGTGRQSLQNLEGKSPLNPEGDLDTVEFTAPNLVLPPGTPNYKPNLMLSACYLYNTVASPMACIDPNPELRTEDKSCTVQNINTGGSQGAPIAITSIETQATPKDMVYRIHLSNVGGGQVFDRAAMSNCPFMLQYKDLDKIMVEEVSLGTGLRPSEPCKPANPVRLVNGQATVFCKFAQPGGPAFQTPLNIKLVYGYKDTIQRQVEIQNLES